jgi:hypothetical protein
MLTCHGLVAGGFGFAVADFVNMLGRAQWGPIGRYQALQGLDYWKWMEQLFGLVMGWGVALGFRRLVRGGLAPAEEDRPPGLLSHVAPLFLLTAMLWENFFKNVRNWLEHGQLGEELFGLGPAWWFFLIGALLVTIIIVAASRHRRGALPLAPASALGRAQLLFLLVLWMSVAAAFTQAFPGMARKGILLIHVTFWLTAGACTLIVLALREEPGAAAATARPAGDRAWLPGRRHWLLWALVPLVCLLLAQLSVSSHAEPLYGSHRRFESGPGQ